MLARGNENFRAPGENRTRDPSNTRSDVLTTEPPGLYSVSEVGILLYHQSVLHFCAGS